MPAGSNTCNSLWQVRIDAWSTLEESTAQLALAGAHVSARPQRPAPPPQSGNPPDAPYLPDAR